MADSFHTNMSVHVDELLFTVGVGVWDWDLTTDAVIYSAAWANILGYTVDELPPVVDTWSRMVLPEDLPHAEEQIERHLSGEQPMYEAEFCMLCKDGSVIWAQDKGRVVEHGEDGTPTRVVGVLQNVTRLKDAELQLRENQESLDLAVGVAGLGTWDWDIPGNHIEYNDEYLNMLGYTQSDMNGSMEEWEGMNHPEDLVRSLKLLDAYIAGEIPRYECEIRMKHRNGSYIWTRDVGKIVARDADNTPIRLIGGHLNIDALKRSEEQLTTALEALENSNAYLESKVASRTKELVEQDRMLWTVNKISRKLLVFESEETFVALVRDCLRLLGESINRNRVYIWKDSVGADGRVYCTQLYEWVRGAVSIQDDEQFEDVAYDDLPAFEKAIDDDCCLNSRICDLSASERAVLEPQGILSILIAPVTIGGRRWGFVGVDNCEDEQLFSGVEETMLLMSGSMLASAIERMENEAAMREMEERNQLMLNATPLCCNLWTADFQNMSCNDEAVRLFGFASQQEYLDRFNEISPEYQPCGRRSDELVLEYLARAFQEGACHFEWLHQKPDGTPIPSEISLVRIKYKDHFIVAGYTRDLREHKTMLTELQSKENDLRTARDEALLSSKAKSNFLANMSHEIRTPMNAISGLAEIILRESAGQKTAEHAKGIKTAAANLLNIINDILDISKIESGKLEIFNSQYELASLINDVITISRMRLGGKQLMFVTDIDSRLPAHLVGDAIRIKQVLINILSNAIKFTKNGHIKLCISGVVEGDRATLRFSVKDSGIGIREEDLARLFAEFERVNTTKNRSIEGTGLGLAISKRLCEMMGGTIEVHSTYGKGAEFVAVIPQECPLYERMARVKETKNVLLYEPRELYRLSIAEALHNLDCKCVSCKNQSELYDNMNLMNYDYILSASLYLKKVQSTAIKNKLTAQIAIFADFGEKIRDDKVSTIFFPVNCLQLAVLLNGEHEEGFAQQQIEGASFIAPSARVLVVDDNPVNLQVAKGLMEPYQFTIETAVNGLEAVEAVKNTQYDLVFMDHMMPVMDGIDATTIIRQMSEKYYQALPIVALTANALVGTREMFIREGMNDFLAKPIELKKLGQILARWLPQSKIVKVVPQKRTKVKREQQELSIAGVNTVQGILLVGGNKENYLHILAAYYADANQKCTLLPQYVAEKQIEAFRTEVHALKSTSATIGALEVSTMAADLEMAAQNGDKAFIDGNIDLFLTALKVVLEAIHPVIQSDTLTPKSKVADRESGDGAYLAQAMTQMYDAAELANISSMEEIMQQLQQFAWNTQIDKELAVMCECLAQFDYDGVLECVVRLQECDT